MGGHSPPWYTSSTLSSPQGTLLEADISYHHLAMPACDKGKILVAGLVGLQTFANTARNSPGLCDVENCFSTERLQTCSIKGNAQIQLLESHECQYSSQSKSSALCPWNRYDDLCLNSPGKKSLCWERKIGESRRNAKRVQKMASETKISADNREGSIA